ncbi:uncharacterized protein B4U79_17770 [Dinothrombium tinctorium]|uniref:Uncharacterized protein n=1 Tax=Dinothrombium tinctorium TaxID=1965070 RepID=A0A3S3PQC6_9ACAR|nr:uncharacterized protein B4U79_17770 [Dinothrombium tinctorium]
MSEHQLFQELTSLQREENETMESMRATKRELLQNDEMMRKLDQKRVQLKDKLKMLEVRNEEHVKKRNRILNDLKHKKLKTDGSMVKDVAATSEINETNANISHGGNSIESYQNTSFSSSQTSVDSSVESKSKETESGVKPNYQSLMTASSIEKVNPVVKVAATNVQFSNNKVFYCKMKRLDYENQDKAPMLEYDAKSQHTPLQKPHVFGMKYGTAGTNFGRDPRLKASKIPAVAEINPFNGATMQVTGKLEKLQISINSNVRMRSVCVLTIVDRKVFVGCRDGTVKRFDLDNVSEMVHYVGHNDRVHSMLVDSSRNILFTGCSDKVIRCYEAASGRLIVDYYLYSTPQSIVYGWGLIIVGQSNGYISQFEFRKEFLFKSITRFRMGDKIITIRPLFHEKLRRLLVLAYGCRPTIVNALNGEILLTLASSYVFSPAFLVMQNSICCACFGESTKILAEKKSLIAVYDENQDWECVKTKAEKGVITAAKLNGNELYMAVLLNGLTRIHCYNYPNLDIIWIAYLTHEGVFAIDIIDGQIITGSDCGIVSTFSPEIGGPFHCLNERCNCSMPFARKIDLNTHQLRISSYHAAKTFD